MSTGTAHGTSKIAAIAIERNRMTQTDHVQKLRRHLWESGTTACVGILLGVGLVSYMVLGPELEGRSAIFVSFLLFTSACMVIGGMITFISPLLDLLASLGIKQVQDEINDCESVEKMENARKVCASKIQMYDGKDRQTLSDHFGPMTHTQ